MSTYVLTESLSEFRIRPDQSIDRMAVHSTRFVEFAPAGSTWHQIRIGEQIFGRTPEGGIFRTGVVTVVMHREEVVPDALS